MVDRWSLRIIANLALPPSRIYAEQNLHEQAIPMSTPPSKVDALLAEAQRQREKSYREKALKMYPGSAAAAAGSSAASVSAS